MAEKITNGNDQLGTKIHKALDKAIKDAKKQRGKNENLGPDEPQNKKAIVIAALEEWLEKFKGKPDSSGFYPRPMKGQKEAQGKEDLNISVSRDLLDTIRSEAERRSENELKPDTLRSLVESALTEWLLKHGHQDLVVWLEPRSK